MTCRLLFSALSSSASLPLSLSAFPFLSFDFLPRSTPYFFKYHCLKGWASICTTEFFVSVFVRTSSLLVALYTTSRRRTFFVQFSDPQAKLPASIRRPRYFMFPPRQRTGRTRLAPSLQRAAGRPISNLRFFWWMLRRPPVLRCLWRESREIPMLRRGCGGMGEVE